MTRVVSDLRDTNQVVRGTFPAYLDVTQTWLAAQTFPAGLLGAVSPAFTGAPVAPTAAALTNNTQIATTAFVGTATNFLQAGTGAVTRTQQNKSRDTFSVKDFGAVGDGTTDDTAAINAAILAVYNLGGGNVRLPPGTFMITSSLTLRPNVTIMGERGASTIKQGNAANLTYMIELQTFSANGAAILDCIIDGNRSNNTDNDNVMLVYAYDANDVVVAGNAFNSAPGNGILIRAGLRPRFEHNTFANIRANGLSFGVASPSAQTLMRGSFSFNDFASPIGQHAIYGQWSDYNSICGNKVTGSQAVGVCSTSGTAITWVSGTTFATITAGEFITIGGTEYHITAKASSTALTVATSAGVQVSVAFIAGAGDLISLGNLSYNDVSHNVVTGGASLGIGLHNFLGVESTQKNRIHGNIIYGSGQAGIGVESMTTAPVTLVFDNEINNNGIYDCGQGRTANDARTNYGIALIDFNPTTLTNTQISDNFIRDQQGPPSMLAGIILSGVANGQAFCGKNTMIGCTANGITGGISAILSAGWGSTATVTSVLTHGDAYRIVILPGGAGIVAAPTITVSTPATSLMQPPMGNTKAIDNNGNSSTVFGETAALSTGVTLTYNATPTSGLAVNVTFA